MSDADQIAAAEAAITEVVQRVRSDDPLHAVAQAVLISVRTYRDATQQICAAVERAERIATRPPQTITLEDEQLAPLTQTLEGAAERGVRRYADRIASWRSLLIGAVGIAGLLVGGAVMHTLDAWAADAAMDAARVEVPAVFGALSAGEAAAWARLMRNNPPIDRLLGQAQPITSETRGKAVALAVWIEPPRGK